MKDPFFLVGCPRSGTTLLRLYLNSHSQLNVPSESHFLIDVLQAFDTDYVLDPQGAIDIESIIKKHKRWPSYPITDEVLRNVLEENIGDSLSVAMDALFRELCGDGVTWGEKTPQYSLYIQELAQLFPNAKFVHIVRDGRDVWKSLKSKSRWFVWTDYQRAKLWAQYVSEASSAGRLLTNDRYLSIKYEDLVINPEQVLREVSEFLGVRFEQSILSFYKKTDGNITDFEKENKVHEKLYRPPEPTDVYRWREELTSSQLMNVELAIGRELEAQEYELSHAKGSYVSMLYFFIFGIVADLVQPIYNRFKDSGLIAGSRMNGVKRTLRAFFNKF